MSNQQQRRAFILAHHPDRGGDAEAFVRGLAAFDEQRPASVPARVVVRRTRPLHRRLIAKLTRTPSTRRVR